MPPYKRKFIVMMLGSALTAALTLAACTKAPQIDTPILSVKAATRTMFQAVKQDNPKLLSRALQAGVNVNQTDESGYTPLLLATRWGNSACVRLLLNTQGIDVNKTVEDGETPLYKAAEGGHSACINLLLAAPGIDVNKAEFSYGWTPLTIAAIEGHEDSFRKLIAAPGTDINRKDLYGVNVLFHAAFNGYGDGVRRLLKKGVDLSAFDAGSVAIFRNDTRELTRLINSGYNVNTKGIYRTSPLLWASGLGRNECIRILLQAGADVSTPGSDSRTPLIRAADYGHADSLRLLLAVPDINPNQCDEDGESALGHAAYAGHAECVRLLLSIPETDVNKANILGESPLFLAAMQGHTDCVRLIIAHPKTNINQTDNNGRTPLQIAADSGHNDCAQLLRKAQKRINSL